MLLADILERDANSILLDAYDGLTKSAPISSSIGRTISQALEPKQPKLTILDIPDEVIDKILGFRFASPKHQAHSIRLVNKRLATLALPHSLRTISVGSGEELLKLVSVPLSPLYYRPFGEHVRCFELAFITENYELVGVDTQLPLTLPNLETVRLRFTLGIPTDSGSDVQTLLSEDTLCRAARTTTNASWLCFLSQFQPKKFEWVSRDPSKLYFLGIYRDLRLLFRSWTSLTSIYLEGICLVEHSDLTTWSLSLVAQRLHIRGAFSFSDAFFLSGLENVKDSSRCHALLLEASEVGSKKGSSGNVVPVVTIGMTVVSLKGYNAPSLQIFIDSLTRKQETPLVQGSPNLEAQTITAIKAKHSPRTVRQHFIYGFLMTALLSTGIFEPPRDPLQDIELFSSPGCYTVEDYTFTENLFYQKLTLRERLFGRTDSGYLEAPLLSRGAKVLSFTGVPT